MAVVFTANKPFTDATLPKLKVDPILPDAGALALFIPSITSDLSLDAVDGTINNLAWGQAAALIAGSTQETLRGLTQKTFSSGASGKVERSSKGGIHVINSQTVSAQGQGFDIRLADLIRGYMAANSTHKYFMSLWGATTRASLDSTNQYSQAGISASSIAAVQLMTFLNTSHLPSAGASAGTRLSQNYGVLGKYIRNQSVNAFTGSTAPTLANLMAYIQIGSKDPFKAFDLNKAASGIIYKYYLEDLTVSGRTYAAVDAIDIALYNGSFASNGTYFGDTVPTDPSTIP